MTNKIRGELELPLKNVTYVLKPEHGRAVELDEALRRGIIGTLVDSGSRDSVRLHDMAVVIKHLADDAPSVDELKKQLLKSNLYQSALVVTKVLAHIAGGSDPAGEEDAPSKPRTGSTGGAD